LVNLIEIRLVFSHCCYKLSTYIQLFLPDFTFGVLNVLSLLILLTFFLVTAKLSLDIFFLFSVAFTFNVFSFFSLLTFFLFVFLILFRFFFLTSRLFLPRRRGARDPQRTWSALSDYECDAGAGAGPPPPAGPPGLAGAVPPGGGGT